MHQDFVDIGMATDHETIVAAERVIAGAFEGRTLDDPERGGLQRSDLPTAVKRVIAPVDAQITTHVEDQEVYVSGTSRMASLWTDLTMVQNLLGLLEEEASLIDLLTDDDAGTHVRFGSDIGTGGDLAVVTTTYETSSGATGHVGVIGPMRMDYRRTIRVVEDVSEGLEGQFGAEG